MLPALFPILLSLSLTRVVGAQRPGVVIQEVHPPLSWQKCSLGSPPTCLVQAGKVVFDANWRWYHSYYGNYDPCFDGTWRGSELFTNLENMNQLCGLEGIPYSEFGVTTNGNALRLQFVTQPSGSPSPNVGSRVYLMADDNTYAIFKPLAQEITFDVDISKLPCGIAADIHFAEMAADGGISESGGWNTAGAKYGTGYCGAQCPRDVKFIQGHPNFQYEWDPNPPPPWLGQYGSCCAEMDLWQANSFSTAMTAHPCIVSGRKKCEGDDCGASAPSQIRYNGFCDPDGCDFNPYRMGNPSFYGSGKTVDTTKKFTVVTQFITSNGTPTGSLVEIRRKYVQNGVTIPNPHASVQGLTSFDSITPGYCDQQKAAFGDSNSFQNKGGFSALGAALNRGMVLVLSIYDDRDANMHWLDSQYPLDKSPTSPGVSRGTCATNTGVPADVEARYTTVSVTISNIKFGPIGSTV